MLMLGLRELLEGVVCIKLCGGESAQAARAVQQIENIKADPLRRVKRASHSSLGQSFT
jgi:hypothetical protein